MQCVSPYTLFKQSFQHGLIKMLSFVHFQDLGFNNVLSEACNYLHTACYWDRNLPWNNNKGVCENFLTSVLKHKFFLCKVMKGCRNIASDNRARECSEKSKLMRSGGHLTKEGMNETYTWQRSEGEQNEQQRLMHEWTMREKQLMTTWLLKENDKQKSTKQENDRSEFYTIKTFSQNHMLSVIHIIFQLFYHDHLALFFHCIFKGSIVIIIRLFTIHLRLKHCGKMI